MQKHHTVGVISNWFLMGWFLSFMFIILNYASVRIQENMKLESHYITGNIFLFRFIILFKSYL